MSNMFIYCLRCPISNDIRYIGQTRRGMRRKYEHMSGPKTIRRNTHLQNWINSLFNNELRPKFEIIEFVDNLDTLNIREVYWINNYKGIYNLCNYELGGVSGKLISSNHISNFTRGNKLEDFYGIEKSEMIRKKISISTSGCKNPNYGGLNINDDFIEKQTISNSKTPLVIIDVTINLEYNFLNSKLASRFIGCSPSNIREAKRKNRIIKGRYVVIDSL